MSFKRGKKYGSNDQKYRLVCEWCGVGFSSSRPETNCCGNAHKLQLHRWRKAYLQQFGFPADANPRGDDVKQNYFKPFNWRKRG